MSFHKKNNVHFVLIKKNNFHVKSLKINPHFTIVAFFPGRVVKKNILAHI